MSIKVTDRVWKHSSAIEGALLVLLAIADFADDNGEAFPSIPTLARKARVSEQQVRNVIRRLVKAGELAVEGGRAGAGRGHKNRYRVLVERGRQERSVSDPVSGVATASAADENPKSTKGFPEGENLNPAEGFGAEKTSNLDSGKPQIGRRENLKSVDRGTVIEPSVRLTGSPGVEESLLEKTKTPVSPGQADTEQSDILLRARGSKPCCACLELLDTGMECHHSWCEHSEWDGRRLREVQEGVQRAHVQRQQLRRYRGGRMKTLINPSTLVVRVTLSTGESMMIRPMSLARVEGEVVRAEWLLPDVQEKRAQEAA